MSEMFRITIKTQDNGYFILEKEGKDLNWVPVRPVTVDLQMMLEDFDESNDKQLLTWEEADNIRTVVITGGMFTVEGASKLIMTSTTRGPWEVRNIQTGQ